MNNIICCNCGSNNTKVIDNYDDGGERIVKLELKVQELLIKIYSSEEALKIWKEL